MKNGKENFKTDFKLRVYNWTLRLIKVIDFLSKDGSSQIMARQVLRSGTSIGANYIEAQAASSKKDFTNFLHHSLKSANESKFWLALLRDSGKMRREDADYLLRELDELSRILGSSLITVKGRR
ncbi:four helix bundle protein [Patescibacteria group bacterium]|nr:four helix bundle protein [Patescibacteria group bacterium]MBU4142758.1 four helix bundle protein [Patescibacteria group bacterium]